MNVFKGFINKTIHYFEEINDYMFYIQYGYPGETYKEFRKRVWNED